MHKLHNDTERRRTWKHVRNILAQYTMSTRGGSRGQQFVTDFQDDV